MIIHITVHPEANNEKDCTEETMSYQAYSPSFDEAENNLRILRGMEERKKVSDTDF